MNYVGIPFVDGGRERSGLDCWGLVKLVFADHGIALPSYAEIGATELLSIARTMDREKDAEPWRPASKPYRKLDVVVMRRLDETGKVPSHVGVMLDAERMLHITKAAASHVVRLGSPSVPFRVLGVFRHTSLA